MEEGRKGGGKTEVAQSRLDERKPYGGQTPKKERD